MKRRLQFIVLMLAAGLTAGAADAEIVVGTAGPFSGPNATLGEQIRRGAQMAVDELNATGGLRGEPLRLEAIDDGCDPKKAVDAATKLVAAKAAFVAGHYCSGASIPASKIYEAASVVQISPSSTHAKFTDEGGWNVFRICPRDDNQATAAGKLIASRFPTAKVALLNDQSPASVGLAAKVKEALAAAGITPVVDEGYKPGGKDYGDLAQKLRDSGATVVYLGGSYVESALIAESLRAMGSTAQFIGSDALLTDDFWKAAGDTAEGTLVTFMFDPQKFDTARPVIDRFRSADIVPEGHMLYAYAAVQAWVQAAEATGTQDSHRIAEWLRAGNQVKTVTGTVSFTAKGDLAAPRIAWFRWSDGRYSEVTAEMPPQ